MRSLGTKGLDDFSKTAICIPFDPNHTSENSSGQNLNLDEDWELRVEAYKDAWKKCLTRMQDTILRLQRSSTKEIVKEVRMAYSNTLPALPHPEIPVVSVINPSLGSSFLDDIIEQVEHNQQCNVVQLYPGDFPNLVTAMRSIVSSFVIQFEVPQQVKRKGGTALASYDIKLLAAWYEAWAQSVGSRPNLVIVLHDFEQLDPLIMQDVFDICSSQVPQVPIVFLLSMTHPSSNYLNTTYTRSTLSLLRVRSFTTLTGQHILNEILLKTFFDLDFQPAIMIGPSAILYLQEYFTRYHSSVDAIYTIIQLAYMKHFATEPLAILVDSPPSADVLRQHDLLDILRASLTPSTNGSVSMAVDDEDSTEDLLSAANEAREQFNTSIARKRLSVRILFLVQGLLQSQGHTGVGLSTRENKKTFVDVLTDVLQCKKRQEFVDRILKAVRGLGADDLDELIEELYQYLSGTKDPSPYVHHRTELVSMRGRVHIGEEVAADVAEWMERVFRQGLIRLEDDPLWEVWYTGLSPFPSELLNPSIRASLMAGLLRPFEFQDDFTAENAPASNAHEQESRPIAELPDTSILFKRYLDSGKMINVYDWFEAFKSVLDTQAELIRTRGAGGAASPSKKGRGKAKAKSDEVGAERDEEKWNVEVQARFIRALHELDYLGFIKHTGRKADHVQRTIFDIDDAE